MLAYNKLKTDTAQISCSNSFVESSLDETIIERSHDLPGSLAEEHHQEDVTSRHCDAGDQRHPAISAL